MLSAAAWLAVAAAAGARAQDGPPTLDDLGAAWLPANESSGNMPTVTNFWGSATISADPLDALGVATYDAFPFVGWIKTRLSAVDGAGTERLFAPTSSRWFAHHSERLAAAPGMDFTAVEAAVSHRFLFESTATLINVTLRNTGPAPVRLRSLQLILTAGVRTATEMSWIVPLPADDGSWACGVLTSGRGPATSAGVNTPVLRFLDGISRARQVVAAVPPPANFTVFGNWFDSNGTQSCGGNMSWGDVELAGGGGTWTLALASVPDTDILNATAALLGLLADPAAAVAASDAGWAARWAAAFTPGNAHFSGHAPLLAAGSTPAVASFYYMSVLTLLTAQRTHWPQSPLYDDCPRLYAVGQEGPAGGGAPGGRPLGGSAFWIWDEAYASLTLSLLDPAAVRAYLRALLRGVDWRSTNALDLLSGAAIPPWPDGFGGGGAYAFNALQVFTMAAHYVGATNDTAFLEERLGPGPAPQPRALDALADLALYWREFDADGDFLAEYSDDDGNYLECVPHYRGAVAALQGGSAWMMRGLADLLDRVYGGGGGVRATPAELRALAANVSAATRARLYVAGKGHWAAFVAAASPPASPVPTVVDFCHVGRLLRADLSPAQRSEAGTFFLGQLLFPAWTGWLRALAAPDDGPGSQRADHGTTGSYTTWAALSIEALALGDGEWTRALALFSRFAPVLRLGPLGQAGQVQVIGAPGNGTLHPVFKAPQWPFVNIGAASFADVIVRTLFGFAPAWAPATLGELALTPPVGQGGFIGSLAHLRTPLGRLVTVTSDGANLSWAFEGAA